MRSTDYWFPLYSAAACWDFAVGALHLAAMAASVMRSYRATNKDTTAHYNLYKEQMNRAAAFYTVYRRRIAGTPTIDAAPAVDYTVWDY